MRNAIVVLTSVRPSVISTRWLCEIVRAPPRDLGLPFGLCRLKPELLPACARVLQDFDGKVHDRDRGSSPGAIIERQIARSKKAHRMRVSYVSTSQSADRRPR